MLAKQPWMTLEEIRDYRVDASEKFCAFTAVHGRGFVSGRGANISEALRALADELGID